MILMRDLVRTAYLHPYFNMGDLTVVQENGPMIMFFISMAVVSAAIFYVLGLARSAGKKISSTSA